MTSALVYLFGCASGLSVGLLIAGLMWWRESIERWRAEARAASAEVRLLEADQRFRRAFAPATPALTPSAEYLDQLAETLRPPEAGEVNGHPLTLERQAA